MKVSKAKRFVCNFSMFQIANPMTFTCRILLVSVSKDADPYPEARKIFHLSKRWPRSPDATSSWLFPLDFQNITVHTRKRWIILIVSSHLSLSFEPRGRGVCWGSEFNHVGEARVSGVLGFCHRRMVVPLQLYLWLKRDSLHESWCVFSFVFFRAAPAA